MSKPDEQAGPELIEHADRLHKALYALATSERGYMSASNADRRDDWGPYDHTQEALVQVLAMLVTTRYRAERVRRLMLNDSGEGVAYWLEQEAQDHQWEMDSAHEDALYALIESVDIEDPAVRAALRFMPMLIEGNTVYANWIPKGDRRLLVDLHVVEPWWGHGIYRLTDVGRAAVALAS